MAEGPAKLIQWFWRNFEWNSNSAGMVPGITQKESIPGIQQNGIRFPHHNTNNAQPCPNQSSVFADDQFGHGQQRQTLFSHNHHHPQHPPSVAASSPSPAPTTTPNRHQPPSTTTARLNTGRTRQECPVALQEQCDHATSLDERAPTRCHITHSDVATRRRTTMSVVVHRCLYLAKWPPLSSYFIWHESRCQYRPQRSLDTHIGHTSPPTTTPHPNTPRTTQ